MVSFPFRKQCKFNISRVGVICRLFVFFVEKQSILAQQNLKEKRDFKISLFFVFSFLSWY